MSIALVPAHIDDLEFCFGVTETVMRGYVEATWGRWEPQLERSKYIARFSPDLYRLIVVDGERAGVVEVEEYQDQVRLGTLYLLPPFQSRGIGGFVLQQIVEAARSKVVRLRVLAVNTRAQAFYSRNGFVVTNKSHERVYMERRA